MLVGIIRKIPHAQYAEPYAGSAAIFFAKDRPAIGSSLYLEHLNDINAHLMVAYRTMQDPDKKDRVLDMLRYTLYSQEEWDRAKRILQQGGDTKSINDIQVTWAIIVAHNQSFAGSPNTGWARSIIRKKPSAPNLPVMWVNRVGDAFEESLGRLRWASIHNEDALAFIKRMDSPYTLFYVDPPYTETKPGKGYTVYNEHQWQSLLETLAGIEGSWVMTSYKEIDIPFDYCLTKDSFVNVSRSLKKARRTEYVWVKSSEWSKSQI